MKRLIYPMATVLFISSIVACNSSNKGSGELAHKEIYADLQAIEYNNRATKSNSPILLRGQVGPEKYDALGIPTTDIRNPYMWIVLNVNDDAGGVLAVPADKQIVLSCGYVNKVSSLEKIDSVVEAFLTKKCNSR